MGNSTQQSAIKSLVNELLEIKSPQAMQAFLDEMCGQDRGLRAKVNHFIACEENVNNFLDSDTNYLRESPSQLFEIADSLLGTIVGPYKIREKIGEGGMGTVYLAEQRTPVRRKVALKVVKQGMDTQQILARFEAERQALALMDHPNIATVLDAGVTSSGQSYFVMELVQGLSITEYCDGKKLDTRQRTEILVQVCHAIQHAHQKGVIHRDIKPSNVLVSTIDGVPVPKVIDFGVAKATGQKLSDLSVYTQFSQMVGTPMYISPEQVELGVVDVDTRSDVYSLGVLAYELFAGCQPFDERLFRTGNLIEIQRMIREEEPQRPSHRINTLNADVGTTVCDLRKSDQRRLTQILRGELDWIVMKCLEKDRSRRYQSASDFAADLNHYLRFEAVDACPPSVVYRLKKFSTRHKVLIATSMTIAIALVVGASLAIWQANIAREAKKTMAASLHNERQTKFALIKESAEKESALQRARHSLDQALVAVNAFYVQVATQWLNEDRSLSEPQKQLLQQASNFYDSKLDAPATDAIELEQFVEIAFRSGFIQMRLNNFPQAANRFRKAIEAITDRRRKPSDSWRFKKAELGMYLAKCEFKQSHYSAAEKEITAAIQSVDHLLTVDPGVRALTDFRAKCVCLHADVELEIGHFQAVVFLLEPMLEAGDPLSWLVQLEVSERLISAWLAIGENDKAEELLSSSFRLCRGKLLDRPDLVALRRLELFLMQSKLRMLVSRDNLGQAVEFANEVLERQTRFLTSQDAPDLYSLRNFLDPIGFPEQDWPVIRSHWVRTMITLGVLQNQLGESLSAEMTLGRAAVLAVINRHFYAKSLRHRADLANVYSQLAIILGKRFPSESQEHAAMAAQVWLEASQDFESSLKYHSDYHYPSPEGDFQRFAARFPSHDVKREEVKRLLVKDSRRQQESVPASRARAWHWAELEKWETALGFCEKVIQKRDGSEAYARYLSSICLTELGRRQEAVKVNHNADAKIQTADPLLEAIRQRAMQHLSPNE